MGYLTYKVIKDRDQYNKYCNLLEDLIMAEENGDREDEIELLTLLIEHYDAQQRESISSDPISLIKALMEENGLNQNDIAHIVNRSKSYVSEIMNRRKALSKDVIRLLADHFKIRQDALNRNYELKEKDEPSDKLYPNNSA